MTTLALILFVALPLALVVFAAGIVVGLWLGGHLARAPLASAEWQAAEGARFVDSLTVGTFQQ